MRKPSLLVDTDIFIHSFNRRRYRSYLESESWQVHYSIITKKELPAKQGLSDRERRAIPFVLQGCRQIRITQAIAQRHAELHQQYATLGRADTLTAASALVRRIPLLTGNIGHFRVVARLKIFFP